MRGRVVVKESGVVALRAAEMDRVDRACGSGGAVPG